MCHHDAPFKMDEVVASLAGIPRLSGTCRRRHAKAQSRNSGELARLIGFRPENTRAASIKSYARTIASRHDARPGHLGSASLT